METLEFNQEELRLLQIALNNLCKSGIGLGDLKLILPVAEKLEAKVIPIVEPNHVEKGNEAK